MKSRCKLILCHSAPHSAPQILASAPRQKKSQNHPHMAQKMPFETIPRPGHFLWLSFESNSSRSLTLSRGFIAVLRRAALGRPYDRALVLSDTNTSYRSNNAGPAVSLAGTGEVGDAKAKNSPLDRSRGPVGVHQTLGSQRSLRVRLSDVPCALQTNATLCAQREPSREPLVPAPPSLTRRKHHQHQQGWPTARHAHL
jgi:hypothetical protein